jgi:hypothetical protein
MNRFSFEQVFRQILGFSRVYMEKYRQLVIRINNWLFIERVFLALTLCIGITLFWYFFLMLPLQRDFRNFSDQLTTAQKDLKGILQQSAKVTEDTEKKIKLQQKQYKDLTQKSRELNNDLAKFQKGFSNISEIATLLRTGLDKYSNLQLKTLATLPSTELVKLKDGDGKPLIQQGITIKFVGGYLDTLAYMQHLEKSEQQMLWKSLSYDISDYPNGEVIITFTLLDKPFD